MTSMTTFVNRMISWLSVAVMVVAFMTATPLTVLAAPNAQSEATQSGTDPHVLVRFDAGTTPEMRDAVIAQMGGQLVTWMHQINVAEVSLPAQNGMVASAQPFMGNEAVTFAEADLQVSATSYVPNDPDFSDATMRYGLDDVQALDAWDVITGSPEIVIAVVDSGIKLDHPEFVGRLAPGYDFIDNDDQPNDESGHGTHVAGVIAAGLDNKQGLAGVCPNCRLMPVRVLNDRNLGSWSQLAKGILFAVDNGARVINLSLGSSISSETLSVSIEYAVERGVVVIAAAGNYGSDKPFYPAASVGVIAVGATTIDGERWSKSDFGSYIDLTAPGDLIYSTYNKLDNLYHGYTYMSGTSMAAPFVSGVAGLLISMEPKLTAAEVTAALEKGADDFGPTGWDADYGHGRVNAYTSLTSLVQGSVGPGDTDGDDEGLPSTDSLMLFLPTLNNN